MTTTRSSPATGTDRLTRLSAVFLAISTLVVIIGVIGEHTGGTSERGEAAEGLALESPLPIIVAIIVSVVLAAAIWRRPTTATLAIVAVFGLTAAALDGLELAHLTDRPILAVLAATAVLTHLAAAGTALPVLARRC